MTEINSRTLPKLTDENRFFWTSGSDGKLRFARCQDCKNIIHPPSPICSQCLSKNVQPEEVSGYAKIASYTINYQKWLPNLQTPYAIGIVEIEEQPNVRLTTNIVNCELDDIHIGMRVKVLFEQCEDVYLPLFEPAY